MTDLPNEEQPTPSPTPLVVEFSLSTERWRVVLLPDGCSTGEAYRGDNAMGVETWTELVTADWSAWGPESLSAILAAAVRAAIEAAP